MGAATRGRVQQQRLQYTIENLSEIWLPAMHNMSVVVRTSIAYFVYFQTVPKCVCVLCFSVLSDCQGWGHVVAPV